MPELTPGLKFTCEGQVLHQNSDGSFNVQFGPSVQVRLFPDQLAGLSPAEEGQEAPKEGEARMPLEDPRRAARRRPAPETPAEAAAAQER